MFKHTTVLAAAAIGVAALGGCAGEKGSGTDGHRGHRHGTAATSHKSSGHVEDADQDFLPGRVKSAFTREFHGATIEDVEKRAHADGEVHWEIRFKDEAGRPRTAEFDTDGNLVTEQ